MILNIKKLDGILRKFGISISQFYFVHCLHTREKEALQYHCSMNPTLVTDLSYLEGLEILEYDSDRDKPTRVENYIISQKFIDELYLDIDKAGQEFYDAYPSYLEIDGRRILTKKGDKDALMSMYCKGIDYDIDKHKKILQALKLAEKQGSLNMAIRNFIESELYNDILGLLDKPSSESEFRGMV